MALFGGNDEQLRLTIKAKDEASAEINKVNTSIGRLAGGFAIGTVAVDALKTGFRFLSATITDSIARHEKHMEVQRRLIHIFKQSTDASDDSIRSLLAQADALDKIGVVSEEAIMAAQGTLATFDLQAESVQKLIPAFLDMVVAERGVNATTEDMIGLANGLGKVLQGQVGALSKQGFIFNEYQAELLKTGTETEKVATLTEILSSTYGGLNEAQRENAGSIYALRQRMDELKKGIGSGVVPALNSLFGAFEETTGSMGRNVDVGRIVFQTFGAIGEFAAATAAGIQYAASAIVTFGSYAVQLQSKLSGVSTVMKFFGKDTDQFFSDFREGTKENTTIFTDFYHNLKDSNDRIISSWDEINLEASVLGKAGPTAYQMTAKEAEEAQKKIDDTKKSIQDTTTALQSLQKGLLSEDEAAARALVVQEQKVSDLRQELFNEDDPGRRRQLEAELLRESKALDSARPTFFDPSMAALVQNEQRRASLTDFERTLEDTRERKLESVRDQLPQIVFNFSEVVAGDKGVQEIIKRAFAELDRQSTLSAIAGR